jgi:hypothetical protein
MSRRLRRSLALALVAASLLVAGLAVFIGLGDSPAAEVTAARAVPLSVEAAALPAPQRPAFELGYVPALRPSPEGVRFAAVLAPTAVRAQPSPRAPVTARLAGLTSLGTTNIVLVVRHVRRRDGLWVAVRFPGSGRGADATGWLPRDRIGGYHFVRTRLHVDQTRLTATLFRDGRRVFRARIAVGAAQFPTPRGSFYIRERLTNFDNPFYGPVAFGTSAHSEVLSDWPDGGSIGIHGTNQPQLLPGRVSHGCIRLRNEDILRLSRLMPVGTPVTIT